MNTNFNEAVQTEKAARLDLINNEIQDLFMQWESEPAGKTKQSLFLDFLNFFDGKTRSKRQYRHHFKKHCTEYDRIDKTMPLPGDAELLPPLGDGRRFKVRG